MSEIPTLVSIDPSETRRPVPRAPRPARTSLRVVLLGGLAVAGLAGFAAIASATLGSLAGPQFTRPTLPKAATAALGQDASAWPDLRDGVPALAPSAPKPMAAVPSAPKTELLPAAVSAPEVQVSSPAVTLSEAKSPEPKAGAASEKPAAPAAAAKPARLPQIENAAVLPPARPASLVPATRTAALIAPLPSETTRSRATNATFTALPPEHEAARRKPAPAKAAAGPAKPAAPPARTAAKESPEPAPQVVQAEAEPEQTEFLGVKVPSLAPAGRKIAESVEAFGNAVKSLPDQF